jgi:O-acetyl-ADP-ribose deacetylase (regulator of RNase III)
MIKYFKGTVFNVKTHALVNAVNCVGVMGAGIALEFKLRYPEMFKDYSKKCHDKKIITGQVDYYINNDGRIIVNFPTKSHFKYPSKLIWIEQGLQDFVDTYKKFGITSVAFPKLGINNGGLNWDNVKLIMEKYLSRLDIDVYICLDEKKEAEGIEKIMLDKFNLTNIDQLAAIAKLNEQQKENIQKSMPYKRFWEIINTKSVGAKTYSIIFRHFYNLATIVNGEAEQLSLFDLTSGNT